ncbi:PilC/PilY family type IV pilus protein [Variovorax sp. J22P168]|uniref:PilC/PilY family type IV pilus protein n=1 Tax=Variovorax jilinensis TaxID=3053513 RepID=UPI00257573CE|nr:PilC/PilY family type IV pilus protein [Variovorax sp. J22P168]MDM0014127.1 PilC/PilY family type IV pilus protein [Variovorax sp. J22P168]
MNNNNLRNLARTARTWVAAGGLLALQTVAMAATNLADEPVFATSQVPGNLALALSVEWPTASRTAHVGDYSRNSTFLGYFDPNKCYDYVVKDPVANSRFEPVSKTADHTCGGKWSGNFLNWAATATIDPFRWAMTGGRRIIDGPTKDDVRTETVLQKGWHSGQGLFPDRTVPNSEIAGATPFTNASKLNVSVNGRGFGMRLSTSTGSMKAEYFNSFPNQTGTPVVVENDNADHSWGEASPAPGVNQNFSSRYTGTYVAPVTGTYSFRVTGDDGVRLTVNGVSLFGETGWKAQGATAYYGTADLTAGTNFTVQIDHYDSGGGADMRFAWRRPGSNDYVTFTDDIGNSTNYDYVMSNLVCVPGLLESNCVKYGDHWKPEGLIQEYSQRMRFSAFGYLNDDNMYRDGGVLRARQKFVGPMSPVPNKPSVENTHGEWDPVTGVQIQNPDTADASDADEPAASRPDAKLTISNSGVMNYLNKFGQITPGNYKGNDPVSEMYYAALRYYRNLGNVPEWSSMAGTDRNTRRKYLDGFPVIRNWDDPIQHSCQRNFVLGIGDIYTHADKNVPGNANFTKEPAGLPQKIVDDKGVNAVDMTNKVGVLQGMGADLGTRTNVSSGCCDDNTAMMAGLAFDANTRDLRDDLKGKQTVRTYWVDVLERAFEPNNQFYLAAKYGGMRIPEDIDPYSMKPADILTKWWSTSGEKVGSGNTERDRPDNYFEAGRPDTMVKGLTEAFKKISNEIKDYTTSFSLSTVQISSLGAWSYASQYDSVAWTGVVTGNNLKFNDAGDPFSSQIWNTDTTLGNQFKVTLDKDNKVVAKGWDTGRRVVTWNGSAGAPFRYDSLTGAQQSALDTSYTTGNDASKYVEYLRGSRTDERTEADASKSYRLRAQLLGDIVNSKVTPVGPPLLGLSEAINPGYAAFKNTWKARTTMVFVGANDGMLHAFKGTMDDADSGTELFAYVPSFLFAKPDAADKDGLLAQLGSPDYNHRFYVDATPLSFDIDLNWAGGTFKTTSTAGSSNWRTLLIGGLGKGGKGFYALDITDPSTMTGAEADVAKNVKWEFTEETMGYSYGAPVVVKTKKYGWVVVFTSGYNSSDGKGHLYIVNPDTGALLQRIDTPTAADGMAQAAGFIVDFSDGTADSIYAGDLQGQLWRFDLSLPKSSSLDYPAPELIATMAKDGVVQPITTQPLIEVQPLSKKRFVLFGTGKLLHTDDLALTDEQTFYALMDGNGESGGFNKSTTLPEGVSFPITRDNLTEVDNLKQGAGQLPASSMGWYANLGYDEAGTTALRLVSNPTSYSGIVAFASLQTEGDACAPSGVSQIYALDLATGKTVLIDGEAFHVSASAVTDLKFLSVDGKVKLVAGDVAGGLKNIGVTIPGALGLRMLNWREVPTVD